MNPEQISQNNLLSSQALKKEGLNYLAQIAEVKEKLGKPIDNIICLGSGITLDESENVTPKNITKMNVLASVALYYMGYASKVIIAGGPTLNANLTNDKAKRDVSEAQSAAEYLESCGIDVKNDPNIIEESESKTTIQNAQNSLNFIGNNQNSAIVASPYHLARATDLFKEVYEHMGKGATIDESYASNQILTEFYYFIKRHCPQIKDTTLGEIFDRLTLEIALVTKEFENLSLVGDGGLIPQLGVRAAYKIGPVRKILEGIGEKRGEDENKKADN